MFKVRKALILTTAVLLLVLAITACGRRNELNPNTRPTIHITSYEGVVDSTGIGANDPALFQQKIYWEANDVDGVVDKYAYRVVDKDGNPYINGTPGHDVVDEDGWVFHYNDGADETIPLYLSTQKSIWTNEVYSVINFPANIEGESAVVVSRFDVQCKDNSGELSIAVDNNGIETGEDYDSKYFSVYSLEPGINISSTKGDINGEEIGQGIVFQFTILDDDPYVGPVPDCFKFRLEKRDLLGRVISEDEGGYPAGIEYTTKNLPNINKYLVTQFTDPMLRLNTYSSGVPQDSTYLIARSVDLAGIESEENEIGFAVKEGFYPGTIVYDGRDAPTSNNIFALGDNHFTTYIAGQIPSIIPSVLTAEGTHFSTPFWIDKDGYYSVIGSNNLNIYMKWGYNGEYGLKTENGVAINNNPNASKIAAVLDEVTNKAYFSEIVFYDLRLDGEPYYYAPLPASDYNIIDPETGKEWLRIPVSSSIAGSATFTGLDFGMHKFEVRAIDLQGVADATPDEFIFKIIEPTPKAEKSGILIIDDEKNHNATAPTDLLDSIYLSFLEDYDGEVTVLTRDDMHTNNYNLHFSTNIFSPTDLQQYKLVIYHSDSPKVPNNFTTEYDAINLYLAGGGNLVFSGCSTLKTIVMVNSKANGFPLITRYFGLPVGEDDALLYPTRPDGTDAAQDAFLKLNYFVKAVKEESMPVDMDLLLPSFNENVNQIFISTDPDTGDLVYAPNNAYGPLSYFNEDLLLEGTEVVFRFGCKEAGDGLFDPTLDEYNKYSGQPVAIRKVTENNSCYMFGFPLSYMNPEQVKDVLNHIISEIETVDEQ